MLGAGRGSDSQSALGTSHKHIYDTKPSDFKESARRNHNAAAQYFTCCIFDADAEYQTIEECVDTIE